jgi:transposase
MLFPQSIEDCIPADAPVRAYDAFVNALDFEKLGIKLEPHKVGCPQYDPRIMLKLLVFGYAYGIRSSRKLEREIQYNLAFIWLAGGLQPDHKTIAEFRRRNKPALSMVLKQCARLCIALGLMEGNTLFADGSKFRANASIDNSWTEQKCHKRLKKIDDRIAAILSECEQLDQAECDSASLVRMEKELSDAETLKAKVVEALKQLETEGKKSINLTDQDCTRVRGRDGSHAGYNVQTVVDEKHGLIVSSDVVNENNDLHQFSKQIEQAHEALGKKCQVACADAGYATLDELEKVDEQDVKVIVPSSRQASKKEPGAFDRSCFQYNEQDDTCTCPQGHVLRRSGTAPYRQCKVYRSKGSVCRQCCHFGVCTTNRQGRVVTWPLKQALIEKLESQYEQAESQDIYSLRKQKAELPFGHIKHNLGVRGFLLRGLAGVRAEASILSSCFNIARMITIIGVADLISKLAS